MGRAGPGRGLRPLDLVLQERPGIGKSTKRMSSIRHGNRDGSQRPVAIEEEFVRQHASRSSAVGTAQEGGDYELADGGDEHEHEPAMMPGSESGSVIAQERLARDRRRDPAPLRAENVMPSRFAYSGRIMKGR